MTFWYHEHLHFLIWGFAIIGYTLLIKVGVATELRSDGVIPCGPIRRCLLIPWISQLFAGSQDLEQGCLKRWLKTQRKRPDQLEFPWNSLRPNKEWSLWWSFSFPRGLSLVFELSGNPLICSHGGWKWSGSGAIMQLIRPKVDQVQRKYKNDQDRFPPICTKKKSALNLGRKPKIGCSCDSMMTVVWTLLVGGSLGHSSHRCCCWPLIT